VFNGKLTVASTEKTRENKVFLRILPMSVRESVNAEDRNPRFYLAAKVTACAMEAVTLVLETQ
jgi:hypothetical protein